MKKRKLIIAIMMAALLAGCGDSGSAAGGRGSVGTSEEESSSITETSDTKTDTDAAAESDTKADPEPTAEPAAANNTNETVDEQPMPDEDYEEYDYGFEGVEISVSWDEEGVTFFEDSGTYDFGENPMCAPMLLIEGAEVQRETDIHGTQHNERILITDRDEHVHITVEPCAPSNNCPLATVSVIVTDSDKGIIGSYTGEELIKRGDTGIWYLDVYEQ